MPNKWVGDRFVPRPVVSYGVYEGPARFGRPVEGSEQLESGDDELRLAFGQGLWGRLPDDWQVIDAEMYAVLAYLRKMATAEDAADRRCLVLSDCKPALQQIEAAYRRGSLEGLREWDRGGVLEGICRYRAQLESVTFLWVPSHAGCASNAYADAAATAYMGASEIEDATAVIRGAVRTRPCLYTERRRTADGEWRGDVLDRRTYYATRGHTNEWVRGRLGEGLTAGSHTAGVTGPLWSDVVRGTTRHKWDKRQRIKDQHGEREIEFADVDDHNVVTKTVMGARVRQQAGVPHGAHHERIMRGEAGRKTPGATTRSELRGCLVCKAARDAARRVAPVSYTHLTLPTRDDV